MVNSVCVKLAPQDMRVKWPKFFILLTKFDYFLGLDYLFIYFLLIYLFLIDVILIDRMIVSWITAFCSRKSEFVSSLKINS